MVNGVLRAVRKEKYRQMSLMSKAREMALKTQAVINACLESAVAERPVEIGEVSPWAVSTP